MARCQVQGCTTRTKLAFCREHWRRLPRAIRRQLSRTRRSGRQHPEQTTGLAAAQWFYGWRGVTVAPCEHSLVVSAVIEPGEETTFFLRPAEPMTAVTMCIQADAVVMLTRAVVDGAKQFGGLPSPLLTAPVSLPQLSPAKPLEVTVYNPTAERVGVAVSVAGFIHRRPRTADWSDVLSGRYACGPIPGHLYAVRKGDTLLEVARRVLGPVLPIGGSWGVRWASRAGCSS